MDRTSQDAIKARIRENYPEIAHSMMVAATGNPFAAEPDAERRVARLQSKANLTPREAEVVNAAIERPPVPVPAPESEALGTKAILPRTPLAPSPDRAEKVWGDTLDFMNVSFLEKGARIARAVGRVAYRNGTPLGTGFLFGNGLFITNHHVVPSADFSRHLAVEFDYELDLVGNRRSVTRFAIDPAVFVTDPDSQDGLDYAIFTIGERLEGVLPLETFGWSGLSDAGDKHMLGEFANIVQHPSGRFKEVVLRENRLVGRYDNALHYVADTEPGSSGSPVFNSEWRPIALHHWGSPWREVFGDDGAPADTEVNEGIRISAIVKHLRSRLREMSPPARDLIAGALDMGEAPEGNPIQLVPEAETAARKDSGGSPRVDETGRVSWTIPLEISVHIPALGRPAEKPAAGRAGVIADHGQPQERSPADQYRDRGGYKRGFIDGFDVPLPRLSDEQRQDAARNQMAESGDDPFELKYHHFSVVMNGKRRLAFFTACNIDGSSAKEIDRDTKTVRPLNPNSPGIESLPGDAEADTWRRDLRIDVSEFTGEPFYAKQAIPGFPKPQDKGRIARMFQKGHLVRRLDPAWGDDDIALLAEADSFYWTNAAPQVGFFNQGTADPAKAGTGGGALWRAVENYVLRNAVAEKQRVTSFSGPIFTDNDRVYRGVAVPTRFFKVTVWAEDGELRSLAMIADQGPVIETWPEALFTGREAISDAEAYMDADELDKVEDFLSTIADIERATGLDFGEAVRACDVRAGGQEKRVKNDGDLDLKPPTKRSRKKRQGP